MILPIDNTIELCYTMNRKSEDEETDQQENKTMRNQLMVHYAAVNGFTHYTETAENVYTLFRPAPSYPGQWGQKVVVIRDGMPYLKLPTILSTWGPDEDSKKF